MTDEERDKRKKDPQVKYIIKNLCDKEQDKDYVFISYKSDDWEVVLKDVVYRLVHDYGLNVYFDGSFDAHHSLWIEQFPENMNSSRCKGVLAFIDNAYATSYATLLELMYSQMGCWDSNYKFISKPVVPVNLESLHEITSEDNTGLNQSSYPDGTINPHAEAEYALFKDTYRKENRDKVFGDIHSIIDKKIDLEYGRNVNLNKKLCSLMVQRLISYINANDNVYKQGGDLESLAKTIEDACGESVFSKKDAIAPAAPELDSTPNRKRGRLKKAEGAKERSVITTEGKDTVPNIYVPDVKEVKNMNGSIQINYETTLQEIEDLCEYPSFCNELRKMRKEKGLEKGSAAAFDYLFASLLGGCDEAVEKPRNKKKNAEIESRQIFNKARWNYVVYVVSEDPQKKINGTETISPWTWYTNCAKFAGYKGKGAKSLKNHLLETDAMSEDGNAFENIKKTTTLSEIKKMFEEKTSPEFAIEKREMVIRKLDHFVENIEIPEDIM